MPCVSENLLREVVDRIVREVHPEAIILFGSQVENTAEDDSDLDLVVVDSESFGPEHDRASSIARIERVLSGIPIPTDILLYSRDELDRWKDSQFHVLANALKHGRVIYGHA